VRKRLPLRNCDKKYFSAEFSATEDLFILANVGVYVWQYDNSEIAKKCANLCPISHLNLYST